MQSVDEHASHASDRASDREWAELCNLSPDALKERIASLRAEILPRVVATAKQADGFAWEFDDVPADRERLEQLVAFERQCCGGLSWQLEVVSETQRLRLRVSGIDPDSKMLAAFRDTPARRGPRGRLRRLLEAGGLGFGVSLLAFCVLPMGVAVFGGAALAATFAKLDDPLWIAAGSLVLAVAAWLFLGRRRSTRSAA